MLLDNDQFEVRFAQSERDVTLAQELRHKVFVQELGAANSTNRRSVEEDRFDAFSKHLLLIDYNRSPNEQVVGVYRVMTSSDAESAGQFSCEDEYDLTALYSSQRSILELGRSCLHPDYRGGIGMTLMWQALATFIEKTETEILFGVASFHGVDAKLHNACLNFLFDNHLAPEPLRTRSKMPVELEKGSDINRMKIMKAMPPLIKAYLRLGGVVGQGAYIDRSFNTVDVCMILDMSVANDKLRKLYHQDQA